MISSGQVTVGFSTSSTITLKEPITVLPEASVAVTFTGVVPTGKVEPLAGTLTTVTEQLSVAVALKFTIASQRPAALSTVMSPGSERTGSSLSLTVTLKLHWAVLPEASVASQVTVVVPIGNRLPESGVQTTLTSGLPAKASPLVL